MDIHGVIGVKHCYCESEKRTVLSLVFYITLECDKWNSSSMTQASSTQQLSVLENESKSGQSETGSTKVSTDVRWFTFDELKELGKSGKPGGDVMKWLAKIEQGTLIISYMNLT